MPHRTLRTVAILAGLLATAGASLAAEAIDPARAKTAPGDPNAWYDIRLLGVEGQGWDESKTKAPFDRLPARADGLVRPPVWGLSRDSAGLCVRFVTDATAIVGRWTLTSKDLAMPHMPATGVSGLDLYVKDDGRWRWLGAGRPVSPTNHAGLAADLPEGRREYLLYLPLYNGVSSVEIGIPAGRTLAKAPPRPEGRARPIVFYGTSITQGGCASRPGMVHTAILGRRLDYPVINLGFSGNGQMEPELAGLLAEIDPALYVLEAVPNMNAAMVEERAGPFVRTLRAAHPTTPILLVEGRALTNEFLTPAMHNHTEACRVALRKVFDRLTAAGVPGLTYLPDPGLMGTDGEGTVDSSHPSDLGFFRMAEGYEPTLRALLPAAQAATPRP